EVAAAALQPFPLEIPGGDGELIGAGADGGVEVDPVGLAGKVVAVARFGVVDLWEALHWREAPLAALVGVLQLVGGGVTDVREIILVVEEGAVLDQFSIGVVVDEAVVGAGQIERDLGLGGWRERRVESINAVTEP